MLDEAELRAKALGRMVAGGDEGQHKNLNEQELKYQREVEATYLRRVQEILEPVLGKDNLRATVAAHAAGGAQAVCDAVVAAATLPMPDSTATTS